MLKVLFRSHRLTKKRVFNAYTSEYRAYKVDFKASITQHREDFWDIQTEVENDWIESYNKAVIRKSDKRASSNRDAVIKIAKRTIALNNAREERVRQVESNLRFQADEYAEELFKKKQLIDTMNLESKRWITLENYQEKIAENVLIPHNLDNSSYYIKLREHSEMAGLGKILSKHDHYSNRKEAHIKNALLGRYFIEVKSQIKSLSYSPLQLLFEDFEGMKSRIFDYPEKIQILSEKYQVLADAWKNKEKTSNEVYINRLHNQLNLTYKLVSCWNQYMKVAKLDDVEIVLLNAEMPVHSKVDELSADEDEWNEDLVDPNPETSDAYELQKLSDEEVADEMKEKELGGNTENQEDGYKEEFELTDEAVSDFDMYKGAAERTREENSKAIDDMMTEILHDINHSKEYFESQENIVKEHVEDSASELSPVAALTKLKEKVESLQDRDLDLQSRWKQEEILKLIDQLNRTLIEEPHMLLRVYKYHRYEPPVFK